MALQYTTTDNISRRLRGKLEIVDSSTPVQPTLGSSYNQPSSSIGGQVVDPNLIDQLGAQKEAYVDLILSQIYEMPLTRSNYITRNILAEIIECLVISSVMRVHFQGSLTQSAGGDVQGLGIDMERQAYMLLGSLTVGHNIYIPISFPNPLQQTYPNVMPPQPLVLPGESLRTTDQPDTIHRVYTVLGSRNLSILQNVEWYSDCDRDNPYRYGRRAIGSELPDF